MRASSPSLPAASPSAIDVKAQEETVSGPALLRSALYRDDPHLAFAVYEVGLLDSDPHVAAFYMATMLGEFCEHACVPPPQDGAPWSAPLDGARELACVRFLLDLLYDDRTQRANAELWTHIFGALSRAHVAQALSLSPPVRDHLLRHAPPVPLPPCTVNSER